MVLFAEITEDECCRMRETNTAQ